MHFKSDYKIKRPNAFQTERILNDSIEEQFDRFLELATVICGTSISLVTLLGENLNRFYVKEGILTRESRELALTLQNKVLEKSRFYEVTDPLNDSYFKQDQQEIGFSGIRYYAGYPLIDADNKVLGTLSVADTIPQKLTQIQQKGLTLLAQEIALRIIDGREVFKVRHLAPLLELSKDMICVMDSSGHLINVNPAFTLTLGWEIPELIGKSIFQFVHSDDLQISKFQVSEVVKKRKCDHFETRFLTKDGSFRVLDWVFNLDPVSNLLFCIARDVTVSQALEENARKTAEFQKIIFDGTTYSIIATDPDGVIKSFNKGAENIVGYTAEELIDKHTPALFHDPQEVVEHACFLSEEFHQPVLPGFDVFVMKARNGFSETKEWTYIHKSGRRKTVELTVTCLRNKNDVITGYLGIAKDITEQKEAEQELDFLKNRLRITFESMSEGVVIQDAKGIILTANPSAERILGLTIDQMTGKTSVDPAWRCIHENGSPFPGETHPAFQALKTGNSIHDVTMGVYKPDGSLSWINVNADLLGAGQGLVCTFSDVTLRKQAEENVRSKKKFLRTVTDALPGMVGYWTKDQKCSYANKKYLEWFGKTIEEMMDISLRSLLGEELWNQNKPFITKALNGEKTDFERTIVKANGEIGYTWAHYIPDDSEGEIKGFYVLVSDITELKTAQFRLEKANEELEIRTRQAEAASIAKSDFLANMSHEIRTPLNGVIGFADLLMKTKLDSIQQQYMRSVHQSANLLLDVINDILDFSKIEAGKLELDIDKTDLLELVSQSADLIKYQAQEKGLELLLNISTDAPRFIWTDAIRLKQVLVNLMGNATKFTKVGEIAFELIVLKQKEDGKTCFRFSVSDTGVGIESKNLEKIFQAFSQEDASTTRKFGGTGLGLTISNKLLGLMGSKLQVISTPGQGSRFFFDICFTSLEEHAQEWQELNAIKRILVVDDNASNRHILKNMLATRNIEVDEAQNGTEALTLFQSHKYDAVLMDFNMPGMNGLETLHKAKEMQVLLNSQSVILLHSSSEDHKIFRASDELGIRYRLVKPVKMQFLFDCLSTLILKSAKESSLKETSHNTVTAHGDLLELRRLSDDLEEQKKQGNLLPFMLSAHMLKLKAHALQLGDLYQQATFLEESGGFEDPFLSDLVRSIGKNIEKLLAEKY